MHLEKSILEVQDLSHKYVVDWALDGVSFNVQSTGITGLLGSNGAGKSTLMKIVCGCLDATAGDVFVDGLRISEQPIEARRRIGYLPQTPPLYLELTVTEYLSFCGGIRGLSHSSIAPAVRRVCGQFGLSKVRGKLIGQLSGGYRQRIGLAQAVIHRPHLVVLDEPTVGLDPNQILLARNLISEIAADHAVLFSTHILQEVEALCEQVVMLESGRLVFQGTMDRYRSVVRPQKLHVRYEGSPNLEKLQKEIVQIRNLRSLGPGDIQIEFSGDRQIAKAILGHSRDNGWSVNEIYFEQSSLEDVFERLSGQTR